MQEKSYTSVLYFISIVILVTLVIQVYWNYKNFQASEAKLQQDIFISLDEAMNNYNDRHLDDYFLSFAIDDLQDEEAFQTLDSVEYWIEYTDAGIIFDSTKLDRLKNISMYRGEETFNIPKPLRGSILDSLEVRGSLEFSIDDSTLVAKDERLSVAAFSVFTDSLDLGTVYNLVQKEFEKKSILGEFALRYTDLSDIVMHTDSTIFKNATLRLESQSRYIQEGTTLEFAMTNQQKVIFLRVMLGILLSLVLIVAVIASLLFLLRIIRNQKQIAEIKNDFISNITHEFKTPIATISAALEGIQHFNEERDITKTEKYINMSNDQLGKLNKMVERILDMATLDKEELKVIKTPVDIVVLFEKITTKHRYLASDIVFTFEASDEEIVVDVDTFHFENAIDNLIDNAVKYGKSPISITIKQSKHGVKIQIIDSGTQLAKEHADRIFEKFYRVPKGNTHDVKGFGIGLFYTKTIVEKHGGTITVQTKPSTTFNIHLPYVKY